MAVTGRPRRVSAVVVSIDSGGGVVIPANVREQLGLRDGSQLDVELAGDAMVLTPRRATRRVAMAVDGLPLLEPVDGAALTDADVQRWRDLDQR